MIYGGDVRERRMAEGVGEDEKNASEKVCG
jgi:hypothetical protein